MEEKAAEETKAKKEKKISRRDFLRGGLTGAAAGAAVATGAGEMLKKPKEGDVHVEHTDSNTGFSGELDISHKLLAENNEISEQFFYLNRGNFKIFSTLLESNNPAEVSYGMSIIAGKLIEAVIEIDSGGIKLSPDITADLSKNIDKPLKV